MSVKLFDIFAKSCTAAMCLFALAACEISHWDSDFSKSSEPVHAKASILSRGVTGTRSTYVEAFNDKELINTWWIAFVNTDDNVVTAILKRDSEMTDAVKSEDFVFEIKPGRYDVYSFANITQAKVEELAGKTIEVDSDMPDMSNVLYNITSLIPNGTTEGTVLIPMTGKKAVDIEEGSVLEFEVIRMVGKLKFTFSNSSEQPITIKYLKFNPLNEGNVLLLPDYTTLTYNAETNPKLLSGIDTTFNFQLDYKAGTVLQGKAENKCDTCFYVRESLASAHPTGHFLIDVGVEYGSTGSETLYYGLSDDTFTGINRNDYVVIPLRFTDYKIDIIPNFYPPIGGYPAIVTANEQEFYCTFKTQGDFQIRPFVYDNQTGDAYTEYDVRITDVVGDDIFNKKPYVDSTTGEITGELSAAEGKAYVSLEIEVKIDSVVYQVYKRRIYFIRTNS